MIYEVTTSQINNFKDCRRRYWFEYRELLKPKKENEALVIGSSYHAKVEEILTTDSFTESHDYTDAMARAFIKYILPQLPEIVDVEQEFRYRLARGIYLKGKIDAVSVDGLIEHKTTGNYITDEYMYKVDFMNDQVSNYLIAKEETRPVTYTVITKPTIRLKKTETLDEYIERCEAWYDEDTERKIRVFTVSRTKEELEEQRKNLVAMAKEIKRCDREKFFYRNDRACSILGCPFSGICSNYNGDAETLVDFEKKSSTNEELNENGGKKKWL